MLPTDIRPTASVTPRPRTGAPVPPRRMATSTATSARRALLLVDEAGAPRELSDSLAAAGVTLAGQITNGRNALPDAADPHTVLWYLSQRSTSGAPEAFAAAQRGWPVVVLAADPDPGYLPAAIAAGATGYVAAPFTQERLLPALELAAARTSDLTALRADVTEIKDRLDTRKVVERAKGLLMAQEHLTEQAAFRLIQRTAMDRRTSMRDVAAAIAQSLAGAA